MSETENEQYAALYNTKNDKKTLLYIGLFAFVIVLIVILFGRLALHTELERDVLPHTLVGYFDDARYYGDVTILANDWPEWAMKYDRVNEISLVFEDDISGGRIGIFADLVYYENRYELRNWFSGKLYEKASEYYFKPKGPLYLEAVYDVDCVSEISLDEMVPQAYDHMEFKG